MSIVSGATRVGTPSAADRAVKRQRVLDVLEGRGADSVVLRSHTAVAWYLDGVRTHVSLAGDPVAAVVVRRDGDEVRVFDNEADRLVSEEFGNFDGSGGSARLGEVGLVIAPAIARVPWHDALVPDGIADLDEAEVAAELRAARASLLPAELVRYRSLCRDVAEALTDTAWAADPADAERDVAARLAADLVARGIDPLVTLVAGRSRLGHRHPLPTAAPLGDRAMLVVCGRRHGLIANATRWVRWGAGPDARASAAEADAQRRILEVEAAFFDATRAGASIGSAFEAGAAAYRGAGFDAGEWRRHHQGGAAGYAGRDPRGTPSVTDVVQVDQAFAWNPTAPGAKVEDTVLAGMGGIEVLTLDPRWPTVRVAGLDRPAELDRVESG